jgi:hypothetical protein
MQKLTKRVILSVFGLGLAASASAQTVNTPALEGSFASPEAPIAPKLVINPSDLGLTPVTDQPAQTSVVQTTQKPAAPAPQDRKIALYKQLMELNGTSKNVRQIMNNTKSAVRMVVLERAGLGSLSPAQELKFNSIADGILKETEVAIIDQIALTQSMSFDVDEVLALIKANSSPAAARYNISKFTGNDQTGQQIQGFMVEAVVRIVKTFKQSISS